MTTETSRTLQLEEAKSLVEKDPTLAEQLYRSLLSSPLPEGDESTDAAQREREVAVYGLVELWARQGRAADLVQLSQVIREQFDRVAKAKMAKMIRTLLDALGRCPSSDQLQISLCEEVVQWCREEKRTFLRQRVEARLASLYLSQKRYGEALAVTNTLLQEVKRLDDRALLLEVQLLESRIHHALQNLPRARAALTAARTTASAIYVPPALQGEIDMQAGVLHAEERDYKAAFSYFYEAFEVYAAMDDERALANLKYLLMCKLMIEQVPEITALLQGRVALKYQGREVEAMRALAAAYEKRSVHELQRVLDIHRDVLTEDPVIQAHLEDLYGALLERNLLRIIEPYSRLQLTHIAERMDLPVEQVEAKCSQLILDGKLNGILDQGAGSLILHGEEPADDLCSDALQTVQSLNEVVSSLFEKASTLR